ncbi:MAG: hypothetical protein KJ623_02390 [Nanoarchaeota archaeon]|nr:hypothetical protein [Nanoarchaeota archaeon]
MNKRGQVSTYLILGFIFLIIIILLFFLRQYYTEGVRQATITEVATVPQQLESVKEDIKTCADNFLQDSIYYLAAKGGILNGKSIEFASYNITYLIDNKKSLLPTTNGLTSQLTNFINDNLGIVCSGYENAELGAVKSQVQIKDKEILVTVNWPIKLSKGDITGTIDQFSFGYNIRLGEMRNIVSQIVDSQIKYYPSICLSCVAEIAVNNNALVERYFSDNTQIFLVKDKGDNRLIYAYAVDYKK